MRTNKRRTVDWIDDAGLSLELPDEQWESVAGSTGEEKDGNTVGKEVRQQEEEDEDLVYKQATTTRTI